MIHQNLNLLLINFSHQLPVIMLTLSIWAVNWLTKIQIF